jgi:hypothetical protein
VEPCLRQECPILTLRALLPSGHHEHGQIQELRRRWMIVVSDRHLNHQQRAVRGDGDAAVLQNP